MFELNYIHEVIIEDVPLQWMTRLELFTTDLEQFPLVYVHMLAETQGVQLYGNYNALNKQRIFGFILDIKWSDLENNELCDVTVKFVTNIPKSLSTHYNDLIKDELSHRIGIADKVSYDDLSIICQNSPQALSLLQRIWQDKIEILYGKYIPHGRLFDEMYGIVRFSASGNAPKLGKTSEYRMLYWYMKDLGERVSFNTNVTHLNFLEFYLIPTYEELRNTHFNNFSNFNTFYVSCERFWQLEYTQSFTVNNSTFKYAPTTSLPQSSDDFESRYSNSLSASDYDNISQLRQIFNRMPSRLYGYIWNLMTPTTVDFYTAFSNRNDFKEFYRDHEKKKGLSTKVVACYLQQAFGLEAFPIDTWVKTFIYFPLGMNPRNTTVRNLQNNLYTRYNRLDKLEKLIWVSSMANKTNKTEFLDILWCQRYGTDELSESAIRGANPISCSKCILRNQCVSYQTIKDDDIYISNSLVRLENYIRRHNLSYGILTKNSTPRTVYIIKANTFKEIDSHSGLDVSSSITVNNGRTTVDNLVNLL